jgi:hypothetical protein
MLSFVARFEPYKSISVKGVNALEVKSRSGVSGISQIPGICIVQIAGSTVESVHPNGLPWSKV